MPRQNSDRLSSYLHQLVSPSAQTDISDTQLLESFIANRDPEAFTAMLRRHGPLVMGVCRRVLANSDDSEDAFQATFLALARSRVNSST